MNEEKGNRKQTNLCERFKNRAGVCMNELTEWAEKFWPEILAGTLSFGSLINGNVEGAFGMMTAAQTHDIGGIKPAVTHAWHSARNFANKYVNTDGRLVD